MVIIKRHHPINAVLLIALLSAPFLAQQSDGSSQSQDGQKEVAEQLSVLNENLAAINIGIATLINAIDTYTVEMQKLRVVAIVGFRKEVEALCSPQRKL